jgi:soluble lytic murein transglycosylase-like protein
MIWRFSPLAASFVLLSPLFARESVCLTNGFCMEADSHVQRDQTLVVRNGLGTLEFPVDQVAQIALLSAAVLPPALGAVEATAEDLLVRAALEQGLEPQFVRSVARAESGFQQEAVSIKGAIGLMQLMPSTASALGVDAKLAEQNAQGGAKFLREMLLRYHGDPTLALAAYNAGPGAVDKFKGVPPYLETRRYIVKVLADYARQQKLQTPVKSTSR